MPKVICPRCKHVTPYDYSDEGKTLPCMDCKYLMVFPIVSKGLLVSYAKQTATNTTICGFILIAILVAQIASCPACTAITVQTIQQSDIPESSPLAASCRQRR